MTSCAAAASTLVRAQWPRTSPRADWTCSESLPARGLMDAVLDRDEEGNVIRKAGVMAVVVSSGNVRPGDAISVELPPPPHAPLGPV